MFPVTAVLAVNLVPPASGPPLLVYQPAKKYPDFVGSAGKFDPKVIVAKVTAWLATEEPPSLLNVTVGVDTVTWYVVVVT
jgi:hypothetical protein